MSFKGTEHYRKIARHHTVDVSGRWRFRTDRDLEESVNALCNQVDQLEEVADAARALISSPNGEEHSWVQVDEWRRLEAALGALEEEGGKG